MTEKGLLGLFAKLSTLIWIFFSSASI